MKSVLQLVALVCVLPLLATCGGTIRAINDDYASDAPVVDSISPLHGVSGEEVTFSALVCPVAGSRVDDEGKYAGAYIWDFGGGAEPNISTDAEPTVVLRDGLRSPYNCTLTLKANCTGDDVLATYNFTLTVAPLSVLAITPSAGVAGGTATFSAVVGSGNVTQWNWDFGGCGSPSGSTQSNPTVSFDEAAGGIYNGRLIISNDFEACQYDFVVTVIPAPSTE